MRTATTAQEQRQVRTLVMIAARGPLAECSASLNSRVLNKDTLIFKYMSFNIRVPAPLCFYSSTVFRFGRLVHLVDTWIDVADRLAYWLIY